MKKYIFTESQFKKIINHQINEQTMEQDQKAAIDAGTKAFLDAKKIQGKNLTDRIMKYQSSIGCDMTGHMLDCQGRIPENDKKLWKSLIDKNKPFYDKVMDWFDHVLGIGGGSGY
jgi:hypothetical protein